MHLNPWNENDSPVFLLDILYQISYRKPNSKRRMVIKTQSTGHQKGNINMKVTTRSLTAFLFYLFQWTRFQWIQGFMLAKPALYHLSHTFNLFCSGYFEDGVWRTMCLGWSQTRILPISVSQVVMITDLSHQHPAWFLVLKKTKLWFQALK
jgi:hypothetical protein